MTHLHIKLVQSISSYHPNSDSVSVFYLVWWIPSSMHNCVVLIISMAACLSLALRKNGEQLNMIRPNIFKTTK